MLGPTSNNSTCNRLTMLSITSLGLRAPPIRVHTTSSTAKVALLPTSTKLKTQTRKSIKPNSTRSRVLWASRTIVQILIHMVVTNRTTRIQLVPLKDIDIKDSMVNKISRERNLITRQPALLLISRTDCTNT